LADYDVVVIGSGAGGLTAAVALANAGKSVLVVEQHYIAGGWCQSFPLDKYRYSPGVHYIGELAPGDNLHRIYQGLGISRDLEFCELNEDAFDHYIVGDERFDVPKGRDNFINRLKERFPDERVGISKYFGRVDAVVEELERAQNYMTFPKMLQLPFVAPNLVFRGMGRLGAVLDKYIKDPYLRAFLCAQSGDYGLPPDDAPFVLQAAVQGHYYDGGYYPRGGAHRIPRAYIKQLKRKGGSIRLSTPAKRIILENGRAVGVELEDGEQVRATTVVSNADPHMTFNKLIGRENFGSRFRRRLDRTEYSVACFSLFMATELDLRSMGIDSGNYWYYKHPHVSRVYKEFQNGVPDGPLQGGFLTATTLKDPSKRKDGHHTIEVFTFLPYKPYEKFENQKYGQRSSEYTAFKKDMTDRLLELADNIIPDLSKNLTFLDAATPLTNVHYCESTQGSIYGTAKIKRQLGPGSYPTKTKIPGLYMCGASTVSHGVIGVTMSGLQASAQILKCSIDDLLGQNGPEIPIYPSERPEEWMDSLQKRRNSKAA